MNLNDLVYLNDLKIEHIFMILVYLRYEKIKIMKNLIYLFTITLIISSCSSEVPRINIKDFSGHEFKLHQRTGCHLSFRRDKSFKYTLPKLSNDVKILFNDLDSTYNFSFGYNTEKTHKFTGKYSVNDSIITLDKNLFFKESKYSMDLMEDVDEYTLIRKNIVFNQDSTLTIMRNQTDRYQFPIYKVTYIENVCPECISNDNELEKWLIKKLSTLDSWNEMMDGYLFILK
tara:strand:+ start:43 stop:732 length:690 start_codon:yes stop_codon:yes gene_type:complete